MREASPLAAARQTLSVFQPEPDCVAFGCCFFWDKTPLLQISMNPTAFGGVTSAKVTSDKSGIPACHFSLVTGHCTEGARAFGRGSRQHWHHGCSGWAHALSRFAPGPATAPGSIPRSASGHGSSPHSPGSPRGIYSRAQPRKLAQESKIAKGAKARRREGGK